MVRNLDAGMMPAYPDESLVVAVQVLIKIRFTTKYEILWVPSRKDSIAETGLEVRLTAVQFDSRNLQLPVQHTTNPLKPKKTICTHSDVDPKSSQFFLSQLDRNPDKSHRKSGVSSPV